MNIYDTLVNIATALKKHDVRYMIVGGLAVGYHGYFRQTMARNGEYVDKPDIDIWYSPSYDNYFHLLDALEDLEIDVKKHKAENPPKPEFFQYDLQDCTFDLLPRLNTATKFIEAYMRREVFTRNGVEMSVIGYNDLIRHKLALGRPKDLEDVENLKRIKPPNIS